jgi:type IV secretory pathway component VirB8
MDALAGGPAAVSDVPGFVYTKDLIEQANATDKWVRTQLRRTRRTNVGWRIYAVLMTCLVVILVAALDYTIPMIRLVPVLLWTSPDGVTGAAVTPDSLPADLSDASVKAWLWQYVMHRESYSWVEMDYNHYVVEAMSATPVRDAYDRWSSGRNADSYMSKLGRRCVIRVAPREVTEFRRATRETAGKLTLHFDRLVACEDQKKTAPETWTVSLEYLAGLDTGLNVRDILSFNPARIVVTDYPGPLPLPSESNGLQGTTP